MKIIPAKHLWKCEECGDIFDSHDEAEDCVRSHLDIWVERISICGCGDEFQGHGDACPNCKKAMEEYERIMKEKAA